MDADAELAAPERRNSMMSVSSDLEAPEKRATMMSVREDLAPPHERGQHGCRRRARRAPRRQNSMLQGGDSMTDELGEPIQEESPDADDDDM